MRWEGRGESSNVEDRRGMGAAALGGGSLLVLVIAMLFGLDPQQIAQFLGQRDPQVQHDGGPKRPVDPAEERLAKFSKVIFRDTEDVWDDLFKKMGKRYEKPVLVLFSGHVSSACGLAESAIGPFYCPGDHKVYIDLSFYKDMERKLNAPGEFARAYVIAHEVGHHVQRLLGYAQRVDDARKRSGKLEINQMTVRLELQADFLAGVWAHHGEKRFQFLEKGDIESALNAAFEIGDDRLQKKARGYVVPDSFTHGTSKQRMRWFMRGFETGEVGEADKLFKLRYEEL
jgi:predicted metalloprotease